jgi:acetyl-CoA C-acetyltransferase
MARSSPCPSRSSARASATGAAITAKILDEMENRDLTLGLVTLCIGGGQGIALLLARE